MVAHSLHISLDGDILYVCSAMVVEEWRALKYLYTGIMPQHFRLSHCIIHYGDSIFGSIVPRYVQQLEAEES